MLTTVQLCSLASFMAFCVIVVHQQAQRRVIFPLMKLFLTAPMHFGLLPRSATVDPMPPGWLAPVHPVWL